MVLIKSTQGKLFCEIEKIYLPLKPEFNIHLIFHNLQSTYSDVMNWIALFFPGVRENWQ